MQGYYSNCHNVWQKESEWSIVFYLVYSNKFKNVWNSACALYTFMAQCKGKNNLMSNMLH